MKPKILILASIWKSENSILLAARLKDIFNNWGSKLIYYYHSDKIPSYTDFILKNAHSEGVCKSISEAFRLYKKDILGADVILNVDIKNNVLSRLINIGFQGKYYQVFDEATKKYADPELSNTLVVGYKDGLLLTDEIPKRTMSVWDKSRYPYDNVFTCDLRDEYITTFMNFIHEGFPQHSNLVVVQNSVSDFSNLRVVKEGSLGKVYEYKPNLHVVSDKFTPYESNELIHYSHKLVGIHEESPHVHACFSSGKIPLFQTTYSTGIWDLLDRGKFAAESKAMETLTSYELNVDKIRSIDFTRLFEQIYNVLDFKTNLYKLLNEKPVVGNLDTVPTAQPVDRTMMIKFIIIIVIIVVLMFIVGLFMNKKDRSTEFIDNEYIPDIIYEDT